MTWNLAPAALNEVVARATDAGRGLFEEGRVSLEVEAELPDGAPENVVRIVTVNSRTLKFNEHGFEKT